MLQIFGDSPMGRLVQGFRQIFNPEGVKREQILQRAQEDPAFAATIAEARRRQLEIDPDSISAGSAIADANRGLGDPMLQGLDLDPANPENQALLDAIEALSPRSFAQETDARRVESPLAETQVPAEVETARATEATGRAERIAQENRARFGQRQAEIGDPEARAELGLDAAELQVESARLDVLSQRFGVQDKAIQSKILKDYDSWVQTLPPERQALANVAFINPNLLTHQRDIMRMSLTERLALLKQKAETAADVLKQAEAFINVNRDLHQMIKDRQQLINDGAGDDIMEAADAAINNQTRIIEAFGLEDFFSSVIANEKELSVVAPPQAPSPTGEDPQGIIPAEKFGADAQDVEIARQSAVEGVRGGALTVTEALRFVSRARTVTGEPIQRVMIQQGTWEDFIRELVRITKTPEQAQLEQDTKRRELGIGPR